MIPSSRSALSREMQTGSAAQLTRRIKFFQHPDLDEFKRDVLVPRFHKVSTEKPPESRKGASGPAWCHDELTCRVQRGVLAVPGV